MKSIIKTISLITTAGGIIFAITSVLKKRKYKDKTQA